MEEFYQNQEDQFIRDHLLRDHEYPPVSVWHKIEQELDDMDRSSRLGVGKRQILLASYLLIIFSVLSLGIGDIKIQKHKNLSIKNELSAKTGGLKGERIIKKDPIEIHQTDLKFSRAFTLKQVQIEENQVMAFPGISSKEIVINAPEKIPPISDLKRSSGNNIATDTHMDTRKNIQRKISIEPYFFKEFIGYNFSDNDITGANGKEIEARERTMFSASFGVYLNYHFNKHWMLQTGLGLSWSESNIDSSKTYGIPSPTGYVQFKLNTISGYGILNSPATNAPVAGDSLITTGTFSHLKYISIPVIVSYQIPMKHFLLSLGAGTTLNILNNAYVETDVYDEQITRHDKEIPLRGLKKVNAGLIIKAEIGYRFNDKWGVSLISSFKNALGPINLHSALSAYPYNFGFGLGVTYQF